MSTPGLLIVIMEDGIICRNMLMVLGLAWVLLIQKITYNNGSHKTCFA